MYSTVIVLLATVLVVNGGHSDDFLDELFYNKPPKAIVNGLDLVQTSTGKLVECRTDNGRLGECVTSVMCKNIDGNGVINPRFNTPPCTYLEVCCLPANKLSKPFDDKPVDQAKPDGNASLMPEDQDESNGSKNPKESGRDKPVTKQTRPTWTSGCGVRNEDGVGIKIRSKDGEAQFGEFPWMCAILREGAYKCGGSLIHPKVVLTAAHCVRDSQGKENDFKVRAGEWDTQTEKEVLPHQERNVVKIIVNTKFRSNVLHNDIALMILDNEFNNVDNVGVVCLPPVDSSPPITKCLVSGWGKDVFGAEGQYQAILKKIELPIVENRWCQIALRKTKLGQYFELHESFTCAGGEAGKDTCTGDGGSPLVCPMSDNPNRYMQTGIVAWGIGCGENLVPGVYVNVAYFRGWIDQQMSYNNINLAFYQN